MKKIIMLCLGLVAGGGLILNGEVLGSHVLIVNASGVDPLLVESIRDYAQKEIRIPVAMTNVAPFIGREMLALGAEAARLKTSKDVCIIALATAKNDELMHAKVMTNAQVVVVNVSALKVDDKAQFERRLKRWTLRGVAFLFGIGADPDPHCVMHDYRTLEELDKLGMNFSPPWGEKVRKAAIERGLEVRPMFIHPQKAKKVEPSLQK